MDKKIKNQKELTNEQIDENIFDMCSVCSATECTGLIRVEPANDYEDEAYEDIMPYKPPILPNADDKPGGSD
ncbi:MULTISPECIES: hypothetical protein [Anaerostipes]|uniref:hypothetical protein n=1 Tax=Anaerostipes TaxID=207244 RepID=UPI0009510FF2|nr:MULTISPECIES: hypothetical protein [Anaerostipes]MCI5622929.1 hypothetical protein [Anaerostipes sp.]MDY2725863.1 hypothetical protein [Anaerostipes faecalis]OLR59547.1 hypothetical protein BHF70_07915 [Anaerostipes sp. 494a]